LKFLCFSFFFLSLYTFLCFPQNQIKSINVVSDDNYPPYIFRDDKGELQGLLIDEWKLWETKTGITVKIIALDWGKAYKFMLNGKADVLETVFYSEERTHIFDFSKSYAVIDVPVFFNKNLSGITDIKTLRGFTIGVKSGDVCIDIFRNNGISTFKEYSNYESLIKGAANGDVKVFCVDKPPAIYYLYKNNLENEFNYSFTLYTGELHRAVKKGNSQLLEIIGNGFTKISKAENDKITDKWLGTTLHQPGYLRYFIYCLLFVSIAALLLFLFNIFLRRKVNEKTHQLEQTLKEMALAKEKAENSNKLKSEFLDQVSHEIRSPLHIILSFTNLIKDALDSNSEFHDHFKFIDSAGKRLLRTVDLVLNSSEMKLGTYEPTFSDLRIDDIISRIRDEYNIIVVDKGLEFKYTSNCLNAVIHGDKYSVCQIFINLLENAIKYTGNGYISINVEDDCHKFVKVIVEDSGIGMSAEFLDNLFEPFMQEDRGYSRRFEGNGLGLSLVKKYCDMNGASITAVSEKEKGSKFIVTFNKK